MHIQHIQSEVLTYTYFKGAMNNSLMFPPLFEGQKCRLIVLTLSSNAVQWKLSLKNKYPYLSPLSLFAIACKKFLFLDYNAPGSFHEHSIPAMN